MRNIEHPDMRLRSGAFWGSRNDTGQVSAIRRKCQAYDVARFHSLLGSKNRDRGYETW